MKLSSRSLFLRAVPIWIFILGSLTLAQTPPPAAPVAPAEPSAPASPAAPETPRPPNAPVSPERTSPAVEAEKNPPDRGNEAPDAAPPARRNARDGGDFPFGDREVPRDLRVSDAISVFGSVTVLGEVRSDTVSVFGDTTIGVDGKVNGGAVAVLGQLDIQGAVNEQAVSVLGGVTVNGPVRGEVISVLGDVHLGPKAVVDGDLIVVLGRLTRDPGAVLRGNQVRVPGFDFLTSERERLTTWVRRCLVLGRPLAFGDNLGWAWMVALSFLAFYVVLALLFSRGIERCAVTLETRPGHSILAAMLTVLLTPILIVLLCFTVIGVALVPFLVAGLIFAALFGKAAMLAWMGRRFTRFFGDGPLAHAAFAVLIGGAIVLLIYVVPVMGFLVFKLLSWLGTGVVIYTLMLGMKREKPPATISPIRPAPIVPPAPPTVIPPTATASSGFGVIAGEDMPRAVPPPIPAPPSPVPAAVATTFPRAGFWLRMGALAIDLILVGIVLSLFAGALRELDVFNLGYGRLMHGFGNLHLLAVAAYGAVMWRMKGTTVGGTVCNLKVTRVDGREIDWPTAAVRAFGCLLSFAALGLGFIWIVIDPERQSWHDKIAGTVVVRMPKGVSLI